MAWSRTDDLDGSTDNVDLVTVGLQGKAYVLDLGDANLTALTEALEPFLTAATEYAPMPAPPKVPAQLVTSPAPVRQPAAKQPAAKKPASTTTAITSRSKRKPPDREFFQAVRQWASENGFLVSGTGRIPKLVMQEFEAAQQKRA